MIFSSYLLYLLYNRKDENWRLSKEWRQAKKECLKKHNYKCAISGKGGRLDVHHVKSAKHFPKLKFVQSNLKPVKPKLHREIHVKGFHAKVTMKDFLRVKREYQTRNNLVWIWYINLVLAILLLSLYLWDNFNPPIIHF